MRAPAGFDDDAAHQHLAQLPAVDLLAFRDPLARRLARHADQGPPGLVAELHDAHQTHAARPRGFLGRRLIALDGLAVRNEHRPAHGVAKRKHGLLVQRREQCGTGCSGTRDLACFRCDRGYVDGGLDELPVPPCQGGHSQAEHRHHTPAAVARAWHGADPFLPGMAPNTSNRTSRTPASSGSRWENADTGCTCRASTKRNGRLASMRCSSARNCSISALNCTRTPINRTSSRSRVPSARVL